MCRGGQYQQYQHQSANNNGRHNNGAQHGQDDSMRSGSGAAESSAGAGGGHGLVHLAVHHLGHRGRLLRFKSDGHILAKPTAEVNRGFPKNVIISHNQPQYVLCNMHKNEPLSPRNWKFHGRSRSAAPNTKKRYRRTNIRQYRTIPLAFSALSYKIDSEPPRGTRGSGTD